MSERITDSELEIMRILWRENRPMSFPELRKELECSKQWSKSTVQSLIARLRDKGAIDLKQDKPLSLFTSVVTEQEHRRAEEQSFLNKLFGGNAKNLVAEFCKEGILNEADIDELKAYFQMEGDKK
jgi:BlaI family penicillinase repressor